MKDDPQFDLEADSILASDFNPDNITTRESSP
jgi:hypothetical protein